MEPAPEPDAQPVRHEQVTYLALIRGNVAFRRLWIGNIVSLLGDWFNTIALYSLVVTLTGSPFALGAVFLSKMLPMALASPLAGGLAPLIATALLKWSDGQSWPVSLYLIATAAITLVSVLLASETFRDDLAKHD